jgi:hypothetical protein
MVRKGRLELPRYCYRQPLKQSTIRIIQDQTNVYRTDLDQTGSERRASYDFFRTYSHTAFGTALPVRPPGGR